MIIQSYSTVAKLSQYLGRCVFQDFHHMQLCELRQIFTLSSSDGMIWPLWFISPRLPIRVYNLPVFGKFSGATLAKILTWCILWYSELFCVLQLLIQETLDERCLYTWYVTQYATRQQPFLPFVLLWIIKSYEFIQSRTILWAAAMLLFRCQKK